MCFQIFSLHCYFILVNCLITLAKNNDRVVIIEFGFISVYLDTVNVSTRNTFLYMRCIHTLKEMICTNHNLVNMNYNLVIFAAGTINIVIAELNFYLDTMKLKHTSKYHLFILCRHVGSAPGQETIEILNFYVVDI